MTTFTKADVTTPVAVEAAPVAVEAAPVAVKKSKVQNKKTPINKKATKKVKGETPSAAISDLPIKEGDIPAEMCRSPHSIAQFLAQWFDKHFDRDQHVVFVCAEDIAALFGQCHASLHQTLLDVQTILLEEHHLAMATHGTGDCHAVIFRANVDDFVVRIPASSISEFDFVLLPAKHADDELGIDDELYDDILLADIEADIKYSKKRLKEMRAHFKVVRKEIKKKFKKREAKKELCVIKADWKTAKKEIQKNIKENKADRKTVKAAMKETKIA